MIYFGGIGTITPPAQLMKYFGGSAGLTAFINVGLQLAFLFAGLIFLFMIIYGGYQWLASGGDKEAIANARKRITNAILGLAIIALSFLITNVVKYILSM